MELFKEAISNFFKREEGNILNGVSERNLCGRLAIYLEQLLSKYEIQGYYADSEYNRKQDGQVKTILNNEMAVVTITCDIIVHSRGEKLNKII